MRALHTRPGARALAVVAVGAVGVTLLVTPAAAEDFHHPEDVPEATQQMLADAVVVWTVKDRVETWTTEDRVEVIEEEVRTEGEETVITLSADILFEPERFELPATAPDYLQEVLEDVPQGTAVSVTGHTDSVGDDASNQILSEQRAQSVATAIGAARPDLVLTVSGRGETEPVASESEGESASSSARSKNRRVEIRYVD